MSRLSDYFAANQSNPLNVSKFLIANGYTAQMAAAELGIDVGYVNNYFQQAGVNPWGDAHNQDIGNSGNGTPNQVTDPAKLAGFGNTWNTPASPTTSPPGGTGAMAPSQQAQPAQPSQPTAKPASQNIDPSLFGKVSNGMGYQDPATGYWYSSNGNSGQGESGNNAQAATEFYRYNSSSPNSPFSTYDTQGNFLRNGNMLDPNKKDGWDLAFAGAMGAGIGFDSGLFGGSGAAASGGPGSAGWGMDLGGAGAADTSYAANIGAGAAGTGGAAGSVGGSAAGSGAVGGGTVGGAASTGMGTTGAATGAGGAVAGGAGAAGASSPFSIGGSVASALGPFAGPIVNGVVGSVLNKSGGSGSGSSGGSSGAYVPTNRAGMDQTFQDRYNQFGNQNQTAFNDTNGLNRATNWGQYNNPRADAFMTGASRAGDIYGQQSSYANNASNTLYGAGNQAYTMAFDPQQALYNKTKQTLVDDTRAAQYARGVSMTPYGAGVEANTMENFGLDWNNQQLARAGQGVNIMGNAYKGAAGLGNTAGAMQLASGQTAYDAQNTIYGNQNSAIQNYWNNQSPYMSNLNQQQSNSLGYINGANSAANMAFNQGQTNRTNQMNDIAAISGPVSSAIGNIWGNNTNGGSTNYGNPSGYTDTSGSYNNPSAYGGSQPYYNDPNNYYPTY